MKKKLIIEVRCCQVGCTNPFVLHGTKKFFKRCKKNRPDFNAKKLLRTYYTTQQGRYYK